MEETAIILAAIGFFTELAEAKIKNDQTTAAQRQQLVAALDASSARVQAAHAAFVQAAAGIEGGPHAS